MRFSKALTQCYALQDLIFSAANDPKCEKIDLSRLALAWERLEERKRVLRRVPLPGALRPDAPQSKRKRSAISGLSSEVTQVWRAAAQQADQAAQLPPGETGQAAEDEAAG